MKRLLLLLFMAFSLGLLAACGGDGTTPGDNPENTPPVDVTDQPSSDKPNQEEDLPTIAELAVSRTQIESYNCVTEIEDSLAGELVTMSVWYTNGRMKTIVDLPEVGNSISYYDYQKGEMISYLDTDLQALKMEFSADGEEAPDNLLQLNIGSGFEIVGRENYDGYACTIIKESNGDTKLWLMNRYGFPVKMTTIDPNTGEEFTTLYKNVTFNQVKDADVTPPPDLTILEMSF